MFISVFTIASYLSLSWAWSIQYMPPAPFLKIHSNNILPCLGLPSCLFSSGLNTKIMYRQFYVTLSITGFLNSVHNLVLRTEYNILETGSVPMLMCRSWMRFASPLLHMRTETDLVSKMLCAGNTTRQWMKSQVQVILNVKILHKLWNTVLQTKNHAHHFNLNKTNHWKMFVVIY